MQVSAKFSLRCARLDLAEDGPKFRFRRNNVATAGIAWWAGAGGPLLLIFPFPAVALGALGGLRVGEQHTLCSFPRSWNISWHSLFEVSRIFLLSETLFRYRQNALPVKQK